jgi:hypothetical protein
MEIKRWLLDSLLKEFGSREKYTWTLSTRNITILESDRAKSGRKYRTSHLVMASPTDKTN